MAMPEPELTRLLAELPGWIDAIVVHPDVIEDPQNYALLGRRLVIENMDDRKADGRNASELAPYFEALPEAGLCFDVAHAGSSTRRWPRALRSSTPLPVAYAMCTSAPLTPTLTMCR